MRFSTLFFLLFLSSWAFSQAAVEGTITDKETGEPLIGANVTFGTQGTFTEIDGTFKLSIPAQKYNLTVSYVGYATYAATVTLNEGTNVFNLSLEASIDLGEVVLTADIALDRSTPVSFSNIQTKQLVEELASQDLPMILNSTPGTYATQSGGGDGDARINIRGFDQRNIAVMLDGVPVNDMETGWVYWSNWFGLDLVTQTMQVQRGLGASKLSLPSVGGTINILTKGIDNKPSVRFKQELGTAGYTRSTVGISTGRMENGWGISAAGSYKQGDGWVEGADTKGYFYYLRIDNAIGKHMFSFSGFGAPQTHGQRPYKDGISLFSEKIATDLGVPQSAIDLQTQANIVSDVGRQYNENVGYLDGKLVNTRQNFYHKPQFNLRHSWNINENLYLSNVAYLSIGKGGGSAPLSSMPKTSDGHINIDSVYRTNQTITFLNQHQRSSNILRASMNEHFWYGVLSNIKYTINPALTLSGGIDLRSYEGRHYRMVYDLMGGKYFRSVGNIRIDEENSQLVEGDKFQYDNTGFVRWAGTFGLLEYKKNRWSAFLNLSAAQVGYSMEDHMKEKVVQLADTTIYLAYGDAVTYQDKTYTLDSPEAKDQRIDWIYIPSFTFKTGASFKIDERHSIFVNTGYLSRSTRYTNIITSNSFNRLPVSTFANAENEIIYAFEAGYQYRSQKFSANFNGYWTNWQNKPLDSTPTVLSDPSDPDSERIPVNINGVAALHRGIELDFAYKINRQLEAQGLLSLGDWIWNSSAILQLQDGTNYEFDATGVHVGDAAQTQVGAMIRYEPIDKLWFKMRGTFFGKNYANFTPTSLKGATAGLDSWKMPSYTLFDFHSGYGFKIKDSHLNIGFSILNVFDAFYIADATNNDGFTQTFNDFDAKSASVFFGMGRRWNCSVSLTL